MQNARAIATTVAITFVVLVLLAATFVYSGLYNVSASTAHTGLVASSLRVVSDRSIAMHAARVETPALDAAALQEGAEHFHEMCVVCHGAPGVARDELAEGLNPQAPELSKHFAADLSEAQLFWVVKNGIRFTGMPSFHSSHTDEQIWAIAKFVKSMDHMTDAQYEAVIRGIMAANGGAMPNREGSAPMHMDDTTHH